MRHVEQVPCRSMEEPEYSLLQPALVGDYRFDYHRAVESGALVGHSSLISMIHLNVLPYTRPHRDLENARSTFSWLLGLMSTCARGGSGQ